MTPFVGRTQEIDLLHREYKRKRPSLIVIYGRRRVGKSTLILESLKTRKFVYYQASTLIDGGRGKHLARGQSDRKQLEFRDHKSLTIRR
jgi:AAA+ ATPase superfamily predicted ATPase